MKPLISTMLLFSTAIALAHAGDDKSDLERMQGTWIVVALTEKGKALPAGELEGLEVVIEMDMLTAFEKGKAIVKCQIKVDSTKKPKAIDLTYLIGDDKGKTEAGIYKIDKEQFTLVLDEDKKGRPTAFDGKGTESYSVHVLKKKAKEAK